MPQVHDRRQPPAVNESLVDVLTAPAARDVVQSFLAPKQIAPDSHIKAPVSDTVSPKVFAESGLISYNESLIHANLVKGVVSWS